MGRLKRGDIYTVIAPRGHGKPRPAVIFQSRHIQLDSTLVVLGTSDLEDSAWLRLAVEPTPDNGLDKPTDFMATKVFAIQADKIGTRIGELTPGEMKRLSGLVGIALGFADDQLMLIH